MKASEGLKELIDKFQVTHVKNVVLFHNKSQTSASKHIEEMAQNKNSGQ